jgi:hypothetical protein
MLQLPNLSTPEPKAYQNDAAPQSLIARVGSGPSLRFLRWSCSSLARLPYLFITFSMVSCRLVSRSCSVDTCTPNHRDNKTAAWTPGTKPSCYITAPLWIHLQQNHRDDISASWSWTLGTKLSCYYYSTLLWTAATNPSR